MVTAELRAENGREQSHRKVHRVYRQRLASPRASTYRSVPLLVGILLLTLGGNTLLQAFVAKAHYRLNVQDQKIAAIDKEVNRIYIELADLGSERRIASLAEKRLGMHHAQPGEIAFLPGDGSITDGSGQTDRSMTEMMIASSRSERRLGLSERFVEWLHGFGRTMADSEME